MCSPVGAVDGGRDALRGPELVSVPAVRLGARHERVAAVLRDDLQDGRVERRVVVRLQQRCADAVERPVVCVVGLDVGAGRAHGGHRGALVGTGLEAHVSGDCDGGEDSEDDHHGQELDQREALLDTAARSGSAAPGEAAEEGSRRGTWGMGVYSAKRGVDMRAGEGFPPGRAAAVGRPEAPHSRVA